MAHELTVQELEKFSADFNKNPENKVIARSAQRSGVLEASYNDRVQSELTRVFSTELDTDNVTNQKHSGRCWEFATLNVLRHAFGKKYKAKNFTFSQAYNFFWDKIERANMFYNRILDSADMPLDSRQVKTDLDFAGSDGGQFQMAAALVEKYGVVPSYAMPETCLKLSTLMTLLASQLHLVTSLRKMLWFFVTLSNTARKMKSKKLVKSF